MIRKLQYRGSFYPEEKKQIEDFIYNNVDTIKKIDKLKGLIVPHAGWIYSGYTAAKGFCFTPRENIQRIYLIGPSHRYYFNGVALSSALEYETPLGNFSLDKATEGELLQHIGIVVDDDAHLNEHSLEVELPFLKKIYPDAKLIPIVAGARSSKIIKKILSRSLNEQGSFTVISSDLSHYKPYDTAKEIDTRNIKLISSGIGSLNSKDACGSVIINPLIEVAERFNIHLKLIDYKNSGDTAGDKESVVGYCSMEIKSD